jgi:hypothetical protein
MAPVDLVCWANSRKYQGRCVAGLRADGGGWVRPVGRSGLGELGPAQYRFATGDEPRIGDLIRVDLSEPAPQPHQPENWLSGRRRWELVRRPTPLSLLAAQLRQFAAPDATLLGSQTDRVPYPTLETAPTGASLALVVTNQLTWLVQTPAPGKLRLRAIFDCHGVEYDLALTDPVWERQLMMFPDGRYPAHVEGDDAPGAFALTVSLSEPFGPERVCYKLVAGVIALSPALSP